MVFFLTSPYPPCSRWLSIWVCRAKFSRAEFSQFCCESNISSHELMLVIWADVIWHAWVDLRWHQLMWQCSGCLQWCDWGELLWANLMLACDVMWANISKFMEKGTMSNAHAVFNVFWRFPILDYRVANLNWLNQFPGLVKSSIFNQIRYPHVWKKTILIVQLWLWLSSSWLNRPIVKDSLHFGL